MYGGQPAVISYFRISTETNSENPDAQIPTVVVTTNTEILRNGAPKIYSGIHRDQNRSALLKFGEDYDVSGDTILST